MKHYFYHRDTEKILSLESPLMQPSIAAFIGKSSPLFERSKFGQAPMTAIA